jgi:biopolymer transport protein ExbB
VKQLIKITGFAAATILFSASTPLFAQATSLSNLLELVESDRVAESAEYRQRLQEFEQNANRQQEILTTTEGRITEQEQLQQQLSDTFEANEIILADKREILRDRRGDLNELFGTLQGVAGDFLSNFENSLISAQYPGRSEALEEFIATAGSTVEQLDVAEIERFWFYMHQELTESGRVVTYNGDVTLPTGDTANRTITRIGAFNAVSDGEYLSYQGAIGHLQVLPKQPDGSITGSASALQNASSGLVKVGIDPTGGWAAR